METRNDGVSGGCIYNKPMWYIICGFRVFFHFFFVYAKLCNVWYFSFWKSYLSSVSKENKIKQKKIPKILHIYTLLLVIIKHMSTSCFVLHEFDSGIWIFCCIQRSIVHTFYIINTCSRLFNQFSKLVSS